MAISAKAQHQVLHILMETIKDEPTGWTTIVAAVGTKMKIKNWMDVRGVLQYCIDKKMIARTNDVLKEEYIKL